MTVLVTVSVLLHITVWDTLNASSWNFILENFTKKCVELFQFLFSSDNFNAHFTDLPMFYAFFRVIPQCLKFICQRFGTLCLFHLRRQVLLCRMNSNLVHSTHNYLPMKMEQTECSETSAYKIQTPGNYPEESIQHSEHSVSLKSRRSTHVSTRVCLHPCSVRAPFWLCVSAIHKLGK